MSSCKEDFSTEFELLLLLFFPPVHGQRFLDFFPERVFWASGVETDCEKENSMTRQKINDPARGRSETIVQGGFCKNVTKR